MKCRQCLEKINSLETELQAVRTENTQLQQLNKELKDHEAKLEKGSFNRKTTHFLSLRRIVC
jgi:cell division protein FtsB